MSDPMTIQNHDNAGIQIGNNIFEDGLLTHAGGGTIAEGSILGRVTASAKWEEYDTGAATGEEIARGVLTIDSVAAGAGDEAIRVMIAGEVRTEKLIDPNTTNAPLAPVQDELRASSIICISVDELNILDNQ